MRANFRTSFSPHSTNRNGNCRLQDCPGLQGCPGASRGLTAGASTSNKRGLASRMLRGLQRPPGPLRGLLLSKIRTCIGFRELLKAPATTSAALKGLLKGRPRAPRGTGSSPFSTSRNLQRANERCCVVD